MCVTSDLFHADVPDEFIADVFGVMAVGGGAFHCGRNAKRKLGPNHYAVGMADPRIYGPHTFLLLTKRPTRMQRLLASRSFRASVARAAFRHAHNRTDAGYLAHQIDTRQQEARCYDPGRLWPLPNVRLGVSVEDQAAADERIPILLDTPAAVRWISAEPLLGPVDLDPTRCDICGGPPTYGEPVSQPWCLDCDHECGIYLDWLNPAGLDWVVVGGESGRGSRPCNVAWIRSVVDQCSDAGVPCFVKQLGARPVVTVPYPNENWELRGRDTPLPITNRKGADPSEWPRDLRVQEFPKENGS